MFKRFCKFTRNPFHCFYNKGEWWWTGSPKQSLISRLFL
jgi:hypothetical protein